jgi:hypothetical protein
MRIRKINNISIEHLWGFTIIAGILIFNFTHPIRPHDFWWHLASGRDIVTLRAIPIVDHYSHTAYGQPYLSYQAFWLMDVIFFYMYRIGSEALIIFVHSLLISTTYLVVFLIAYQRSQNWRFSAFGLLIGAALGISDWNIRPQTLAFLLGSLILLAITKLRGSNNFGKREIIWLSIIPICMVLWVNSHGTFPIGIILLLLWLLDEILGQFRKINKNQLENAIKRLSIPITAIFVAVVSLILNPRNIGIYRYVTDIGTNSVIRQYVGEWMPPDITTPRGILFFACLLLSCVVVLLSPKRRDVFSIGCLVAFGFLGIQTLRGSIWLGIVMAPIIANHLSTIVERYPKLMHYFSFTKGSRTINLAFLSTITFLVILSLPWLKDLLPLPKLKAGLISWETPIMGTEYLLENDLPKPIFNEMGYGSYLIWRGYPEYKVFVDPRIELYSENIWMDYILISTGQPQWENLLDKYTINTMFLDRNNQPEIIDKADESPDWIEVYGDDKSVVYVRLAEH